MLNRQWLILMFILIVHNTLIANEAVQREVYIDEVFEKNIKKSGIFKIAILPIQNMSMYPNIAYYFRQHTNDLLIAKGYSTISNKILDKALMRVGVQKADHIRLLDFNKLSDMTSADAIMSGIIENGLIKNAGIYSGYSFTASLKLQLANGKMVWYNLSNRVAKRKFAFDPFNITFDFIMNKLPDKHIEAIKAVAEKLLEKLPDGPNEIVIDNLLEEAIEI